jgi:hypothetical protein
MQTELFGRVAKLVRFPFSEDMRCLFFHPVPQLLSFPTFRVSQRSILGEVDVWVDTTYIVCAVSVTVSQTLVESFDSLRVFLGRWRMLFAIAFPVGFS